MKRHSMTNDMFSVCSDSSPVELDDFYIKIISSKAFARLKGISFLGAIDYARKSSLKKLERSRYKHSIDVANLALYVAQERNYSVELTRHLVVAALLHDIGHSPLSHSVEPYTKKVFSIGHHQLGESIILGDSPLGKDLSQYLRNHLDIDFIVKLMGQSSEDEGSDLFNSPVNIDTIDGIVRAYAFIKNSVLDQTYNRKIIARQSFLVGQGDLDGASILDEFWKLKEFIYADLINGGDGILADKTSEFYFENNSSLLAITNLYESEKDWKKTFSPLFTTLAGLQRQNKERPEWLSCHDRFAYKKRKYVIRDEKLSLDRYSCEKYNDYFSFQESDSQFKQIRLGFNFQ
jgi:hypothetical protein